MPPHLTCCFHCVVGGSGWQGAAEAGATGASAENAAGDGVVYLEDMLARVKHADHRCHIAFRQDTRHEMVYHPAARDCFGIHLRPATFQGRVHTVFFVDRNAFACPVKRNLVGGIVSTEHPAGVLAVRLQRAIGPLEIPLPLELLRPSCSDRRASFWCSFCWCSLLTLPCLAVCWRGPRDHQCLYHDRC